MLNTDFRPISITPVGYYLPEQWYVWSSHSFFTLLSRTQIPPNFQILILILIYFIEFTSLFPQANWVSNSSYNLSTSYCHSLTCLALYRQSVGLCHRNLIRFQQGVWYCPALSLVWQNGAARYARWSLYGRSAFSVVIRTVRTTEAMFRLRLKSLPASYKDLAYWTGVRPCRQYRRPSSSHTGKSNDQVCWWHLHNHSSHQC